MLVLSLGARFAGYMQRLKKMDRERLAEAIGTRLDLSANSLQRLETPVVARVPKQSKSERSKVETKDVEFDWD